MVTRYEKYLGPKGYSIRKDCLSIDEQIDLRKDLTVKAFIPKNSMQKATPFPVYRESKNKFYIPKFYGLKRFGQFENKTIRKRYQAIVIGQLPEKDKIDSPIDGKPSMTEFQTIRVVPSLKNEFLTFVNLYPITGRTHQLRVHASHALGLHIPITGDDLYGQKSGE